MNRCLKNMAVIDEKRCEKDDIKKIVKAVECMKHYKTVETVKKDNVVKTYEFAESVHTIKNVEFVKTEEKSEFVDYGSMGCRVFKWGGSKLERFLPEKSTD